MSTRLAGWLFLVGIAAPPVVAQSLPETTAPAVEEAAPAAAEIPLPLSPAAVLPLYVDGVRPQWRQLYRPVIKRVAEDRFRAALGLGAVIADLYLAAESRDATRIDNLLTDENSLERMLGIAEKAGHSTQVISDFATAGDWQQVRRELSGQLKNQRRYLTEQRDEPLADLMEVGLWVRTLQIGASFSAHHQVWPAAAYVSWTPVLARLKALTVPICDDNDCRNLRLLKSRLITLERSWRTPPEASAVQDKAVVSLIALNEIMARLIDTPPDEAPASGSK